MRVVLDARHAATGAIADIAFICRNHPGSHPVQVEIRTSQGPRTLALGESYNSDLSLEFIDELKALSGVVLK